MAITGAWNAAALSGGVVAIVMVLILLVVIFLIVTITKKIKSKCNLGFTATALSHSSCICDLALRNYRQLSGNEVPIAAPAGPVYEEVDLAMTPRTQDIQVVESNEAYGQVRK